MNEQFGEKVKAIFDSITVLQAKDSDLKRDNANINGDSPMGAMLQYGCLLYTSPSPRDCS